MMRDLAVRWLSSTTREVLKVALHRRGLPTDLTPVAHLPGGRIVCQSCTSGLAAIAMLIEGELIVEESGIAPGELIDEMQLLINSYETGWAIARRVATRRAETHAAPRNTELQVLDVRSQDHVLGISVFRWDARGASVSIRVALTCGSTEHEPSEGARLQLSQLLAVAARSGGRLRLVFESSVEGGRIPRAYVELAEALGVPLRRDASVIEHDDAVRLLVAMLTLGEDARQRLLALPMPERPALFVLQGTLDGHELEGLLASAPGRALLSGVAPDDPLHRRALGALLRSERLAGRFERALINPDGASPLAVEDAGRAVDVEIRGPANRIYTALEIEVVVPWSDSAMSLPNGQAVEVRCRDWDATLTRLLLISEVNTARTCRSDGAGLLPLIVVLPADAGEAVKESCVAIDDPDVTLVVAPVNRLTLDRDAARTLRTLEATGLMS